MADCEKSLEIARKAGDYGLLTRTLVAGARAALESNNPEKALQLATEAEQMAARGKNKESQWLALIVTARAQERLGNTADAQNKAAQAQKVFTELRSEASDFADSYLARKDIEFYRK